MADLLWPGDERAGALFGDAALLDAMVAVEEAWLGALAATGIAPASELADVALTGLVGADDVVALAEGAEAGGNPVIGLVALLRERSGSSWVHRGLTSQDVLDTALVLCLRATLEGVLTDAERQARALAGLVREHRGSVMAGRTLTQYAVPTTFGLKAAGWLAGLADAIEAARAARAALAVQVGGAAGTLAAVVELAAGEEPVARAVEAVRETARRLDLPAALPWHTHRISLTRAGDALVTLADLWGRIGADVALLSRPEIGELREATGGGSSTMPGKANPVLSILLRRHALTAPGLGSTLHTAASAYVDERPDGAWHAEWATLRTLARRSAVASSQAADLLEGLVVDAARMRARADQAATTLGAEQRSMGGEPGEPEEYLGVTDLIIDDALTRAERLWTL